jgi:hypothetical protein
MKTFTIRLNERELTTISHALRVVQCNGRIEGCAAGVCEHFEYDRMLFDDELDALCRRINSVS